MRKPIHIKSDAAQSEMNSLMSAMSKCYPAESWMVGMLGGMVTEPAIPIPIRSDVKPLGAPLPFGTPPAVAVCLRCKLLMSAEEEHYCTDTYVVTW